VRRRDAGSATVWALLVVLLIWAAAAVSVVEVAAVQTRHRAEAAADAAALAAAAGGGLDPAAGCLAARRAAARVGADVVGCALIGPYAQVAVAVPPPDVLRWAGRVMARARAGPADTGRTSRSRTSRATS
jgi:secretion/DNA translocation related TadE-like protein